MQHDDRLIDDLRIQREATAPSPARRLLWVLFAVSVVLATGGVVYRAIPVSAEAPATVKAVAAVVTKAPPASAVLLEAAGYVVARRKTTVASAVAGRLVEVAVEEGDRVAAGQVLARVHDDDATVRLQLSQAELAAEQAAREEAVVNLQEARRELARVTKLHQRALVSDQNLETAEAAVDRMQAQLAHAERKIEVSRRTIELTRALLDNYTIRAPFAGVVVLKSAQVGEIISPESAGGGFTRTGLCTIVDMDSLEGEVEVSEDLIQRVEVGQPVAVRLNAYPDRPIAGHVAAIVPTADRQTATVKVRIKFDHGDPHILPEMGIRVSFRDESSSARPAPPAGVSINETEDHHGDRTGVGALAERGKALPQGR